MTEFLKSKLGSIVDESNILNKSHSIGEATPTSKVLNLELKDNPWFISVTGAGFLSVKINNDTIDTLVRDHSISGYSTVTKSNTASRKPVTYLGPKQINSFSVGESGKTGSISEGDIVDLAWSNRQAPNIFGSHTSSPNNVGTAVSTSNNQPSPLKDNSQDLIDGVFNAPTHTTRISSDFGARGEEHHTGVDYPVAVGTDVRASAPGTVTRVADLGNTSYGKYIYVQHGNGIQTRYAHLSKFNVKVGDIVDTGDILGQSGSTGRSSGPHLHFEVRKNGKAIDPKEFIGRTQTKEVLAKDLNPKTGKLDKTLFNYANSLGHRITTGTAIVPNSTIKYSLQP